jgi:prephenate dehydratase
MISTVTFQGESGAYSEIAALTFFNRSIKTLPLPSFNDIFNAVKSGQASAAVVPIENALAGSVHENYDLLLKHKLPIVGEIILPISHYLLALPGVKLRNIRRVISHPQALQQCADFLNGMQKVRVEPFYDTAGSAKKLVDEQLSNTAAIASREATEKYGLDILASGIESNHENYTRFLIIQKDTRIPKRGGKTSIVFSFEDAPGALFKSLAVFALRDINLLKIESRPLHGKPFNYYFYLDIEGSINEKPVKNALNHLKEIATFLQVLGSYPKSKTG